MGYQSESGAIPPALVTFLEGRDTTPLSPEMLVKYQYIALVPTRATNFRYIIYRDGRLYYALNSGELNDPIYNVALPDEPNRVLEQDTLDEIADRLAEVGFFEQPEYVGNPNVRGGAVSIVTARRGDQAHEVWYANVDNALTNMLFDITPTAPVERTAEEEMAYWQGILTDLEEKAAAQNAQPRDDVDDVE